MVQLTAGTGGTGHHAAIIWDIFVNYRAGDGVHCLTALPVVQKVPWFDIKALYVAQ